jgi:uncharacterized protein YuzE
MMIKKVLTMGAGIVLGCMITAASFAWPPSPDCKDARADHRDALGAVQIYRDYHLPRLELKILRESKRACMRVVRQVCPHGTYANADPVDLEICDRVAVDRDENGNIIAGEFYNDNGFRGVAVIERDENGNIISITVETYTTANDILVATYIAFVERDEDGNIISITIEIYDADGNLVATYTYP